MAATIDIQDSIEPLLSEWEGLAQRAKASPFLRPGWISAWWRAFGTGRLQVITAHENGRLTGVLPLRRVYGKFRSPTNYQTPLFGFLAANETTAKQLSDALFRQGPRRVDLSFLVPGDVGISPACTAADAARYRVLAERRQVAPFLDTGEPWEAYEGRLRRKFRSELRRRRRRLEEEGQLVLEVFDGLQGVSELLEEGFRVEGSGWKDAQGTSINSHPATRRFYTEVAHWAAERGWLRLAFLRLDGRVLAFDYCLEYDGIHYLLKTGYDPVYRRFAPGMVIRYLMLARAFSNDISTYEFLGADYDWKREWTDNVRGRLFLRMFAPTALGSLERAIFVHGRPAAKRIKGFASSVIGDDGSSLLRRRPTMGGVKTDR